MAFLCQYKYILNINCLWKILSKIVLFNAYLGFLLSRTVSIPIISSRTKFATLTPCLEVSRQAARTTPWRRGWRSFWGWSTIGRKRSLAKPHSMFHVGHRHTGQHHLVHPGHGVVAELQVLELEGVRFPVPHLLHQIQTHSQPKKYLITFYYTFLK